MSSPVKLGWVVSLRGIAALWVFAYHVWLAMGGLAVRFGLPTDFSFGLRSIFRAGYQGVDLFFVLSGFVIAWPYVSQKQTRLGRHEIVDFYQRRYLRIAPVYYLSLAVAISLIAARLLRGNVDSWAIAAHLLFAENFDPVWATSIRGVYWTLPTEIHFYLIFPLLLRLTNVDRPLRMACYLLAAAIGYRCLTVWLTTRHGVWLTWTAAYLPGRIDQFGCGMAAACLVATARANAVAVRKRTVVLAGLLALSCLVLVSRQTSDQFDFWYVCGASISGAAIALFVWTMGVYAKSRSQTAPTSAPSSGSKLLYLLGEASLSIYLWHTFFIDLALVASYHWRISDAARAMLLLGTVPIVLGVSVFTYRVIEAPIIALSKSTAWRRKITGFVDRTGKLAHVGSSHGRATDRIDERGKH
ncbi:MAG: acyltransferase [Pseudomonadota bacterium]|nr:acyltransferase [Pseudomonadota bacterium]